MPFIVRPLRDADVDALRRLFLSFDAKRVQQRAQGMAPERLADFFTANETARLRKRAETSGEASPRQWVLERDGDLLGFTALHDDPWHSQFYGLSFGRIAPLLAHRLEAAERVALLDAALLGAETAGCERLTLRIDGGEYGLLQTLCERGFYLVDSSVKLSARLADVPETVAPPHMAGWVLRRFEEADLPAVRAIAAGHPHNHFLNDPHLSAERSRALFAAWVERCCAGLASEVFVLEDAAGGVAGFAVYLTPGALNRALGVRLTILDFVCLAPEARGGGAGRRLIAETMRLAGAASEADQVELRTSTHNHGALKCYESLGLRTVSSDFILHRRADASR